MRELLVRDFLRDGGSLDDLAARYAIRATRHLTYSNLVSLMYSQIESPMDDPLVRQCRGLILDEEDHWRVVARPFDKFFNYGEPLATEIDWSSARVQEKVDGTLCIVYFYRGVWHVGTTGRPDASGRVGELADLSYAQLFWSTIGDRFEPRVPALTYLFELTAPQSRIVVRHEEPHLTLLGARFSESGMEVRPSEAADSVAGNYDPVREFPLQTIDQILAAFQTLDPLTQEGFVVVDADFRRIKVKHPGYVALHHLKDRASPKSFVEVIRRGEGPELLAAFPELMEQFSRLQDCYDALVAEVESDYQRLKDIETQKAFALEATRTRCPAALFMLRSRRASSAREYFASCHIDHLMRLLEVAQPAGSLQST